MENAIFGNKTCRDWNTRYAVKASVLFIGPATRSDFLFNWIVNFAIGGLLNNTVDLPWIYCVVLFTVPATRSDSLRQIVLLFHRLRTSLEKVAGLAKTSVTDFRKKNESKWIIQVDNPPMNVKLMRAKRARWTRFDFNWIDCEILFIQKLKKFWILDYGNLKKSDFWKFYRTLYSITC